MWKLIAIAVVFYIIGALYPQLASPIKGAVGGGG